MGAFFPPNLADSASCVDIAISPQRNPLLICSTLAAVCGTRLAPKNHATLEIGHAWVFPKTVPNFKLLHMALTCALDGCSLRRVPINLNWVDARHRELLRL